MRHTLLSALAGSEAIRSAAGAARVLPEAVCASCAAFDAADGQLDLPGGRRRAAVSAQQGWRPRQRP